MLMLTNTIILVSSILPPEEGVGLHVARAFVVLQLVQRLFQLFPENVDFKWVQDAGTAKI